LLGDAKAGTFQAVLLSEQSRMSREDIFYAMQHWRLFRDAGVSIITCQRGELKFDNLGGVITAIVDQYGAREESICLADRVVSGKRLAIRNGQRQAAGLLGYDREILDENHLVVKRVPCGQKFIKPHHWASRLERQLAAIRAKIERGTENLALAEPADVPGISPLLGQWRDDEARVQEQLLQAHGEDAPSPQVLAVMARLDGLLERISEADRDKLAFAVRQTVKRVTLRRMKVGTGRTCVWDGVIELRDDLGVNATIPMTDEDIPSPGLFREVVRFLRERGTPALAREIAAALGCHRTNLLRPLKLAIQLGKVKKIGPRQGYVALPVR
jgi:hypothetical protein